MKCEETPDTKAPPQTSNESSNVSVFDHLKIIDADTNEVIVNKRG